MKYIILFAVMLTLASCFKGNKVDLIIHNGKVHSMNDNLEIFEAIAIMDGKIVEVGPERRIMNRYRADIVIDAKSRDVFPGFHDAHGHIMSLAKQMLDVDLTGTSSYYEMLARLEKYYSANKPKILIGRGWDQSVWGEENLPNDSLLNITFPEIPVALTRVDGHAMLINKAMREWIGITDTTFIEGGEIIKENGKITGMLLDNALTLVQNKLPVRDKEEVKKAVLKVQDLLLGAGLTHVHEAGISAEDRDLLIELAQEDKLKINIYGMLLPSENNIQFAQENGHYINNRLSIRSFKVFADGALGSYGACLIHPYADRKNAHGILLQSPDSLKKLAETALQLDYQLNTHCIGDSANRVMLNIFKTLLQGDEDHRWRIEHAQVVHPDDFHLFADLNVIPSVQPTHATTDQFWAINRLGKDRLENGAYAYNSLQKEMGMILFGTDFPIEHYDPFATIHAATQRKNTDNLPIEGFLVNEAVSLENTLKAMTIWAAFGCFEEAQVGSIERGKRANIVIADQPLRNTGMFLPNYAWKTIVDGYLYYEIE